MTDRLCRNCKHWGYSHSDRSTTSKYDEKCNKIEVGVHVLIDQGSGWDCGGATVEEIETNPSFGCVLFDVFVAESNPAITAPPSGGPVNLVVGRDPLTKE